MASFLADLGIRLSVAKEGLTKGLDQAKAQIKSFQSEVYSIGKKTSEGLKQASSGFQNFKNVAKGELELLGMAMKQGFATMVRLASATAKAIGAVFAASGILAIVAALATAIAGLVAWVKRTQEGSDKLAEIMGYLKGMLSGLINVLIKVGEWLFKAFNDPKAAIQELGEMIKKQLITRFKGMVEIFVGGWEVIKNGALGVGAAISGIFSKKAREDSKLYFEQMRDGLVKMNEGIIKMTTGFSTDEIKDFWATLKESGEEGKKLAQVQDAINEKESKFIRQNAEDQKRLAQIKLQLADMEAKTDEEKLAKAALIEQAQKIQNGISQRAISLAQDKYDLLVATNKLEGRTNDEAVRAEAEAYAELQGAIAASYSSQIAFEKQENKVAVAIQKTVDELRKEAETRYWLETTFEGQLTALEDAYKKGLVGTQEYVDKTNEIWEKFKWGPAQEAIDKENEQKKKAAEEAKSILEDQIENERASFEERRTLLEGQKAAELLTATEIAEYKAMLDEQERMRKLETAQAGLAGMMQVADAISGYQQAQMEEELKAAGDNEAKKEAIQKKYAKKQQKMDIAKAVIGTALAVVNALQTNPFVPLGLIAAASAAAAGAIQIATIKSQSFADGGIVYGETLATVGDYPGARSNPEVISPLNKLKSILASTPTSNQGEVRFVIEQDVLVGILSDYNKKQVYF